MGVDDVRTAWSARNDESETEDLPVTMMRVSSLFARHACRHARSIRSLRSDSYVLRVPSSMSRDSSKRVRLARYLSSSSEESSVALGNELISLSYKPGAIEALAGRLPVETRALLLQEIAKISSDVPEEAPEPSYEDLKAVAFTTSIPFVGFGIMDNALLILCGDAIDAHLGVILGISTMCAAALGNIISDVAGIGLGTVIEDFCAKYLPLPTPNLTTAQRQLRSVRFANQIGCAIGIVIGCFIGMFPLLFIDSNRIQARKREAHLESIFQDVIEEAGGLIGAQNTRFWLLVDKPDNNTHPLPSADGKFLFARQTDRPIYIPLGRGIISRAALTGEAWNIYDVRSEPDYDKDISGVDKVRNMVCVPVLDAQGRAIAVIQVMNKKQGQLNATDKTSRGFTTADVQVLKALASHISVALQRQEGEDPIRLKDTITMLKDYGLQGDRERKVSLFPED